MSTGGANLGFSASNSNKVMPIFAGDYAAADEGSFFTSQQGVVASTAVATTTQVLGQANPTVAIRNNNAVGGYNLYLRYIKLYMTAVTTGATSAQAVGTLDNLQAKLTTATTPLTGPNNANSGSSTTSNAAVYGGVLVAAATSAFGRIAHTNTLTNSIPIVLDTWTLLFGESAGNSNLIGTMSLVKNISVPCPPVIIAPGWWYTLGIWGASWAASAPSYSIECGWIERPSGQ